jgi:hypothetical protein
MRAADAYRSTTLTQWRQRRGVVDLYYKLRSLYGLSSAIVQVSEQATQLQATVPTIAGGLNQRRSLERHLCARHPPSTQRSERGAPHSQTAPS